MKLLRSPAFWNVIAAFFSFASALLQARANNGSLAGMNLSLGAMFLSLAVYYARAQARGAPRARPAVPPSSDANDRPLGEQTPR